MQTKKKILISNFRNLDNYGSAMMGLVTIQALVDKYGANNIEIYCEFDDDMSIEKVQNELPQHVNLYKYQRRKRTVCSNRVGRIVKSIILLIFTIEERIFDEIIVLGGDDISEYYGKYEAALLLFTKWKTTFFSEVILLGQTLGPFNYWWNKIAIRLFLPRMTVFARDKWCVDYLKEHFNIRVNQSVDLAFNDLPKQHDKILEKKTLSSYNLEPNKYITVVLSGLVKEGYYCSDEDVYIDQYYKAINFILMNDKYRGLDIVLLAHTFPPYGDEVDLINKMYVKFTKEQKKHIKVIVEKILPTRARFILGNGLFTITGRMHPAVSTYQMGKPAICLSYSNKYQGVIGDSLERSDLIIDAKDNADWISGKISTELINKIKYLFCSYEIIQQQINGKVVVNKGIIRENLSSI